MLAKLWLLCVALLLQAVTMMLPVGEQQTVARHGQAVQACLVVLVATPGRNGDGGRRWGLCRL